MAHTKTLSGALRHADAAPLAAELSEALAEGDLVIDTTGITQASCGVVQVIASAQVTARVLERNLQVDVAEGSAFAATLDRLGLRL
jgi:anti-anti-sigma regulatory factor